MQAVQAAILIVILLVLYAVVTDLSRWVPGKLAKRNAEKEHDIIETKLKEMGFECNKRIVLADFFQNTYRLGEKRAFIDLVSGIWLDYDANQIAICIPKEKKVTLTEQVKGHILEAQGIIPRGEWRVDKTIPQVFPFSAIESVEILEDSAFKSGGITFGYGPVAVGGGSGNIISDGLAVRIVTSGKYGTSALIIKLLGSRNKLDQNSDAYQNSVECARAMYDELTHIANLS